jgi:putative ABC transport system ATP-binding protein
MLKAHGLSYVRGGQQILADLDLSVEAGESLAVIGPSGSGKTSLLALLSGLSKPSSGTVYIDGQPLRGFAGPELGVALVLQGYGLVSLLTAAENVEIALRAAGRPARDARRISRTVLTQLGLEAHADQLTEELSGGQQQRTAVARALALEPRLLIADEPTAELDPAARAIALAAMFDVAAGGGSLVLATHDPEVATRCDRILDLRSGQLLTSQELADSEAAALGQEAAPKPAVLGSTGPVSTGPEWAGLEPDRPVDDAPAEVTAPVPAVLSVVPAWPQASASAAPPELFAPSGEPDLAAPPESAEPPPAEISLARPAPVGLAPAEPGPAEPGPPKLGPAELGPPRLAKPTQLQPPWATPPRAEPADEQAAAAVAARLRPGRHRLPPAPAAHRRGTSLRGYLERVQRQALRPGGPADLYGFAELGLRLLELHQRAERSALTEDLCVHCGWRWPCPTFLTLLQLLDDVPDRD